MRAPSHPRAHANLSLGRHQAGCMDEFFGEEAAGSGSRSARTGAVRAGRGSGARGDGSGGAAMRRMRRCWGGRCGGGERALTPYFLLRLEPCPPARIRGRAAVPLASAAACLASRPGGQWRQRSRLGATSTSMSSAESAPGAAIGAPGASFVVRALPPGHLHGVGARGPRATADTRG